MSCPFFFEGALFTSPRKCESDRRKNNKIQEGGKKKKKAVKILTVSGKRTLLFFLNAQSKPAEDELTLKFIEPRKKKFN